MGTVRIQRTMLTRIPLVGLLATALADVPVSCPYSSTLGTWEVSIGSAGSDHSLVADCGLDNLGTVRATQNFKLEERNMVTNMDTGTAGTYTIVSSQGFEITIDERKYWAYYYFDSSNSRNNDCSRTMVGYQRDVMHKTWSCIQMMRTSSDATGTVPNVIPAFPMKQQILANKKFSEDRLFLVQLNNEVTWSAKHHDNFEQYTLAEMQNRMGHERAPVDYFDELPPVVERLSNAKAYKFASGLPEAWDWRNVDGSNYDSPVWDQSGCGSCFAFASKSVMEGRFRVQSNLVSKPIFSVQEMITCGADMNYNQGCGGGFAYLVAGKYADEYGFVDESCNPETLSYQYASKTCPDTSNCKRWYSTKYEYLGCYYGAATVETMMAELVANGPVSVGIYCPSDFHSYAGGVYYVPQSSLQSDWNPLVPTNHAVVVVGYGRCPSKVQSNDGSGCNVGQDNLPYWIVKNSWGASWGEDGYIKILLGVDEIAIESKPFIAQPVAHF